MIFDRKNLLIIEKNCKRKIQWLFGRLIDAELDRFDEKNFLLYIGLEEKNQDFVKIQYVCEAQFYFGYLVVFLANQTLFYFGGPMTIN